MPVREKTGNLFTSAPKHASLAHCISADCKLGAGIALAFCHRGYVDRDQLARQGVRVGGVAILKKDKRFIYNLVTKERYFYNPSYLDLEKSLCAMKQHAIQNNITEIALPRIGCGLDGLQWDNVLAILWRLFPSAKQQGATPSLINITVYTPR